MPNPIKIVIREVPPLLIKDKSGELVPLVNLQGKFIDSLRIIGGKYVKNEYYETALRKMYDRSENRD